MKSTFSGANEFSHLSHSYHELQPLPRPLSLSVFSHSVWVRSSLTSVSSRGLHNPWQLCHESPQCGIGSSLTLHMSVHMPENIRWRRFFSVFFRNYIQNHVSEQPGGEIAAKSYSSGGFTLNPLHCFSLFLSQQWPLWCKPLLLRTLTPACNAEPLIGCQTFI